MTRTMRLLATVCLVLGMAWTTATRPTFAAGGQVPNCSFATLQTDRQVGGDRGYVAGQCPSSITGPRGDQPRDISLAVRPAVPDDRAPRVRVGTAVVTAAAPAPETRDVVISNTDSTLKDHFFGYDAEPAIAVNPANPNEVDITAFSGWWDNSSTPNQNAPIWHSVDGGNTWTKELSITPPPGTINPESYYCPCDQTIDYGRSAANRLFGAFQWEGTDTGGTFHEETHAGSTTDPTTGSSFDWYTTGSPAVSPPVNPAPYADQPWLLTGPKPANLSADNVYIGYDDLGNNTEPVAVAPAGDAPNFTVVHSTGTREACSTQCLSAGHRLAVDSVDGTVYSLWQVATSQAADNSYIHFNLMLNRSTDSGQTWSLNGSPTGIAYASVDSTQYTDQTVSPKFGTVNALIGGVDAAAVDPTTHDLFIVYGSRDASGNNRLYLARWTTAADGTMSLAATTELTAQTSVQAALPGIAVTANGTVGVLYDTYDGMDVSGYPSFSAHFALSRDHGATFSDTTLESFLSPSTDDGNTKQRVLGDFQQLKAVGHSFYGTFSGNRVPYYGTNSTIDPIFFTLSDTSATLQLNAGWNLISLPLQPTTTLMASALLSSLLQTNGASHLVALFQLSGNSWSPPVVEQAGQPLSSRNDFPVTVGTGYLLYSDVSNSYTEQGTVPATPPAWSLHLGWNLVGLSAASPANLMSNTVLEEVRTSGTSGGQLAALFALMRGSWQPYQIDQNGTLTGSAPFALALGQGYLLFSDHAASVTPSVVAPSLARHALLARPPVPGASSDGMAVPSLPPLPAP